MQAVVANAIILFLSIWWRNPFFYAASGGSLAKLPPKLFHRLAWGDDTARPPDPDPHHCANQSIQTSLRPQPLELELY